MTKKSLSKASFFQNEILFCNKKNSRFVQIFSWSRMPIKLAKIDSKWSTVSKRPTYLWSGYFLARPNEIFLTQREKIENLGLLREIFPDPEVADPTRATKKWPDPTWGKNFWPRPITTREASTVPGSYNTGQPDPISLWVYSTPLKKKGFEMR